MFDGVNFVWILAPFTLFFAHRRLLKKGATFWDDRAGLDVAHRRLDTTRVVIFVLAMAALGLAGYGLLGHLEGTPPGLPLPATQR